MHQTQSENSEVVRLTFKLNTIRKSNRIILMLGQILKKFDADDIIEMINQYNHAEGASIVFDALAMEGSPYPGGRAKFWDEVSFKKSFLQKLEPLVRFLNEQEAKARQPLENVS